MEEDRRPKCDGCCTLRFEVAPANRPPMIAAPFWLQATATGEICGHGNEGHVQVAALGLVPFGVYTLFFTTDRGPWPAGPLDASYTGDGFDPNRLVVNGEGILSYYVAPLDFNPLKGVPTPSGLAKILGVVINYHPNGSTNGLSPGVANVDVFDQLIAPMCYPRQD